MVAFLLAACSSAPKIPARGRFLDREFSTTVDGDDARYYLEEYRHGRRSRPALDARIEALTRRFGGRLATREELNAISAEYSVDFASAFFADQLLGQACNRRLNEAFFQELTRPADGFGDVSKYVILFVPGWDYASNGHLTGADLKEPRRLASEAGFENHLVELPPTGSVDENARVVKKTIAAYAGSGKRILLAGASSAGPAIHLALSESADAELEAVAAWLNLGGILQGSPLVDYLQQWPQRWLLSIVAWFKGWSIEAVGSMATAPSRARFEKLRVRKPGLLVVNYVGIPLSGQLTKFASDKYPLLKADGPNDGLTLVRDVIAPDSLTIVALGNDHFFAEDPLINRKTQALMKLIVTYVEGGIHASSCAPAPQAKL